MPERSKPDRYGVDVGRLAVAAQNARLTMRWTRDRRAFAVRQGAGSNWSEEAAREKIHLNLISIYSRTMLRQLAPNNIRVCLSSFNQQMKTVLHATEQWFCEELSRTHFARSLGRVIHDALYGFGIFKVGLATPSTSSLKAYNVDIGEPYADRIDYDDWLWDIHARDISECSFMAHRFRVQLARAKEEKRYNATARKQLFASTDPRFNPEGDQRINVLGRGYYGADEELEDMVDLWEFYLPRANGGKGAIVTLPDDYLIGSAAMQKGYDPIPLGEEDYIGPDEGPYHILGFEDVPGNLMPKGPIMDLLEMHLPLNNILRKLIRQAERMKQNTVVKRNSQDVQRARDSNDGDLLELDFPDHVKTLVRGGPDQLLFQFFIQMKAIYSWMADNLDTRGGLSPEGRTATQAKIVNENSQETTSAMMQRTMDFTSKVCRSLLWYHWHHPEKRMHTTYSPKGAPEYQTRRTVHPWNTPGPPGLLRRDGNWEDVELSVYPFINTTPAQRSAMLKQFITTIVMPMQQQAAQQGVFVDFNALFEKIGILDDDPDYAEILHLQDPVMPNQEQNGGRPAAAQPTEHTRISMPGRTQHGNDMMQMNSLAGIDSGGNGSQPSMNGVMQ